MAKIIFRAEWVSEAKAGSQQAIKELYESSWHEVSIVIRTMVRTDSDTVQDLVQDTFVKAFQRLDQLDDSTKYHAWIKQIARNTALDHLKKSKAILFSELYEDDSSPIEIEDEDQSHLPDVTVEQQDVARLLHEMLNSLSEMQRTVFSMHYIEDIPVKEIAAILERSAGTIKKQLYNARDNLQKKILEIEKKENIKLHGIAPLPFLLLLLRGMESTPVPPNSVVIGSVSSAGAASGTAAAGSAVGSATKTAGRFVVKKITAGILAAVTLAGGAAIYASVQNQPEYPERDLFTDGFRVKFVGEDGSGAVNVYSLSGYSLDYDADPKDGLSNGDVVTLTLSAPNRADLDEYCKEHYGFTPIADEKEYIVSGLDDPGPVSVYDALVADYSAVIRGELSVNEIGLDLSKYDYPVTPCGNYIDENGYLVIRYEVQYCSAEYDINDDGIKELLFLEASLECDEYSEATIMEIYTFYDGAPLWLIAGAERCQITLCENGIIHEQGNGGAEAIGDWYYEIINGQLVLIESAEMNWGTFYVNGEECEEAHYRDVLADYTEITAPEFDLITVVEK